MEENGNTYEGGCTCGAVRYRMETKPLFVHCCHCRWCQRETGSSYALNALIEADRMTMLQGEAESVLTATNSGKGQKIWRCPDCCIALWSNYTGLEDKVCFFRVGTLDEAYRLSPDLHIYTASKQSWVLIPQEQPAVDEYYDREKHWPEDSLDRLRQCLGLPD